MESIEKLKELLHLFERHDKELDNIQVTDLAAGLDHEEAETLLRLLHNIESWSGVAKGDMEEALEIKAHEKTCELVVGGLYVDVSNNCVYTFNGHTYREQLGVVTTGYHVQCSKLVPAEQHIKDQEAMLAERLKALETSRRAAEQHQKNIEKLRNRIDKWKAEKQQWKS